MVERPIKSCEIQKGSDYCDIGTSVALLACFIPYSIVLVFSTTHGLTSGLDINWLLTAAFVNFNASLNR